MTVSEVLALATAESVFLTLAPDGSIELIPPRRASKELRNAIRTNKRDVVESLRGNSRGPPSTLETPPPAPRLVPPNTTPVPDIFFDEIAPTLGEGELRIMLYLIRRTYGFKQTSDQVSLSQFEKGIVTRDGRRLDHGAGIKSRPNIVAAIASLEQRTLLLCDRVSRGGRGHANTYRLNLHHEDSHPRE